MGKKSNNFKWDFEKCKEEALKYESKSVFKLNSGGAYQSSRVNGWLVDICQHMIRPKKQKIIKWTKEICTVEALKYNSRGEFSINSSNIYSAAMRNDWLDEICSHMELQGNKYKRCIYSYEFTDNNVYVGLTYNMDKRHSDRMRDNNDAVIKHIIKTKLEPIRTQLTEYINVEEAIKMEEYYVNSYKENGWFILNRIKTGGIGGHITKWSYEKCKKEALKYNTKTEFKHNNGGAYSHAWKNSYLNEICEHMSRTKWTYEKCKNVAIKYKTRNSFQKNGRGAYIFAYRNLFLDEICQHMKKGGK